jgi:hypothetical protein
MHPPLVEMAACGPPGASSGGGLAMHFKQKNSDGNPQNRSAVGSESEAILTLRVTFHSYMKT